MFFHIISLKPCPLSGGCHGNGAYVPKREANQKRDPPSIGRLQLCFMDILQNQDYKHLRIVCVYLLVYIIYLCLTVEWECEIKNVSFYFGSYTKWVIISCAKKKIYLDSLLFKWICLN